MTKNDDFPAAIRDAARELRYDSLDSARANRIRANIMERVARQPEGLAALLSGWWRIAILPLAAAAAIAVTASVIVHKESVDDYGTRTELVAMHKQAVNVDE
jgi:hypothetical protein